MSSQLAGLEFKTKCIESPNLYCNVYLRGGGAVIPSPLPSFSGLK